MNKFLILTTIINWGIIGDKTPPHEYIEYIKVKDIKTIIESLRSDEYIDPLFGKSFIKGCSIMTERGHLVVKWSCKNLVGKINKALKK